MEGKNFLVIKPIKTQLMYFFRQTICFFISKLDKKQNQEYW